MSGMRAFGMAVLVFFLFSGNTAEKQEEIKWLTISEAEELAKTSPRKIFIDVYTDWCGWCKKMDKVTFQNPEVVEYVNEHYYAVKLNAESDDKFTFGGQEYTGRTLARALRVTGYPTVVLINEELKQVTPAPGFRQAEPFIKMLQEYKERS